MCGGYPSTPTYLPANQFCCPQPQIFVEELCGTIVGPFTGAVWTSPTPSDYFQGTFTVTNEGVGAIAIGFNGVAATIVPEGTTVSISVNRPDSFDVVLGPDQQARYCIKLYKRVN